MRLRLFCGAALGEQIQWKNHQHVHRQDGRSSSSTSVILSVLESQANRHGMDGVEMENLRDEYDATAQWKVARFPAFMTLRQLQLVWLHE